jgi:hypothetical protein
MKITAKYFEERVGRPPKDDDLERCNCRKAGQLGHHFCGWDMLAELPRFMAGTSKEEKS